MGGTPAYVFVVRHGNRLDAADKRWHLSSPTPYDPPLTYGGFLQSRLVGNQIASILEQAKIEQESSAKGPKKRRRFKVVIHSSPFLRCVQTSIGISSGLAQTPPESPHHPSDVFVSATGAASSSNEFKPAILRLDSFLGEWLCPEYFESITPPPGAALMVGSAKADLLRREDYSTLTQPAPVNRDHRSSSASLWTGSPSASPAMNASSGPPSVASDKDTSSVSSAPTSSMAAALSGQLGSQYEQKKGYAFPKPNYAISSSGVIPEGFVAHARDHCVVVDYQWDSMRAPLDFGDGGQFGEEWTSMHKRFRRGLKKMAHWYSTTESPTEMVTKGLQDGEHPDAADDEEVETVVILVSHGAGCNALIGAITHQPVLMDVGIASITMAVRKPDISYDALLANPLALDSSSEPYVSPHELFDIRLSASTDHLRSTASTPVSARSTSNSADMFPAGTGSRGRAPSMGNSGPLIGSFVYSSASDPFLANGSRSSSANAVLGSSIRRDSASQRPTLRTSTLATSTLATDTTTPTTAKPATNTATPRNTSPGVSSPSFGLWSPAPSSLRLMDDGGVDNSNEEKEDFGALLPNFDQARFKPETHEYKPKDLVTTPPLGSDESEIKVLEFTMPQSISAPTLSSNLPPSPTLAPFSFGSIGGDSGFKSKPRGPILSAPIKIKTHLDFDKPAEEISIAQLDSLGGTWGLPMPPGEAERLRDLSMSKRRWTTTERA